MDSGGAGMTVELHLGDCLEVMAELPENSVDTIITDPPYGLTFMGKDWDRGVPGERFWREALRVAKPGACLMAMGGTRTFHRLVCAIEDAGWEVRDTIAWLYGSGFPKSFDISKGIDKQAGAQRERGKPLPYTNQDIRNNNYDRKDGVNNRIQNYESLPATPAAQLWHGWGTALKPAMELICVAYNPREGTYVNNALKWGVAGLNIDGGRVYAEGDDLDELNRGNKRPVGDNYSDNTAFKIQCADREQKNATGRFPANVIHDGSDEVTGLFPQTTSGGGDKRGGCQFFMNGDKRSEPTNHEPNSGSAARFFYTAKASRSERNAGLEGMEEKVGGGMKGTEDQTLLTGSGNIRNNKMQNHHPTVKPLALMRYLARLTKTPTGGVVLDPFMGSGTTGMAAVLEGRDFIGIELDPEYLEIAQRRIEYWQKQMQPRLL